MSVKWFMLAGCCTYHLGLEAEKPHTHRYVAIGEVTKKTWKWVHCADARWVCGQYPAWIKQVSCQRPRATVSSEGHSIMSPTHISFITLLSFSSSPPFHLPVPYNSIKCCGSYRWPASRRLFPSESIQEGVLPRAWNPLPASASVSVTSVACYLKSISSASLPWRQLHCVGLW